MPKLTVKSIQMRNFGTVRDSTVQFPDRGFILVNGLNHTGFESVGTGKTLLGEALSRALFNVPGRFTRFGNYSTHSKGNTYVRVDVVLEDQPLVVEIGHKCAELSKGGEGLRFTLGNQTPVMYGNIQDTRQELLRMFGMQTDVAGWTVFIDGSQLNFEALSEMKAVNLLMGALNQPPWTEYHKKAARVLDKFKNSTETAEGIHNSVKLALEQAQKSLTTAQTELQTAETEYATLKTACDQRHESRRVQQVILEDSIAVSKAHLKELHHQIEAATEAEAQQYHEAETMSMRCASIFAEAQRNQARLEREYGEIQKAHEKLKTDKQTAINTYTTQAHAVANTERNKLLKEIRQIEQRNSKAKKDWDATEKTKSKAVDSTKLELQLTESRHRDAAAALEREQNTPCTCPLPGCGKPWPRTNQKAVEKAQKDLTETATQLSQAQVAAQNAKTDFEMFGATPAVQETVPQAPDEQAIAPFPEEGAWVEAIGNHTQEVLLVHQKLSEQIVLVGLTDAQAQDAQKKVNGLKEASKVPKLSEQYEELEKQHNQWKTDLTQLQNDGKADVADNQSVELARVRVNERQLSVQQHEVRLVETSQEVSDSFEAQKIAGYWVEAFGATGIPNMIINEAIVPLNSISKRVSLRMTNGILEVVYGTKRQLNSGQDISELSIMVNNKFGSSLVAGSSKGEAGLLNLVIAETLAEVGNVASRVGYRWYDEITRSQDQVVRRAIFSYLKELANNLGILTFVVDHSTEVASYADHVLIAEKALSGETTYTWQ
jgi:DNA repair exonuclease SbcCD ATPase subunit